MNAVDNDLLSVAQEFELFFRREVDGDLVEWTVGPEQKSNILGGAYALLHLINFEEPFGLSVIEALACGTPVVALHKGSMPEIIDSGTTGFVVDSLDEVLETLGDIPTINREDCRESILQRFTEDIMVDKYAVLFERLVSGSYAK